MFENIIEQSAVFQLRDDILSNRDAPSMLFYGQPGTGKGSAALELARVLSCKNDAAWKCKCSACERHRYLQHDDILALGSRSFSAEILACQKAFLRNPANVNVKTLFFRSLRKLQIRFSPVLMENDSKTAKAVSSDLQSLDEGLNELLLLDIQTCTEAALNKLCNSLVKDALALENEVNGIPISHIRSASYWCRLAPNGKRKTLIIENAENMRDDARNSLLKLLEEPPSTVSIVLTAQRKEAILETVLSRLRPYRFLKRSAETEKEVIRRIFQDKTELNFNEEKGSILSAYLDSFLPQNAEKLYPLAAWFIVSFARTASIYAKNRGEKAPVFLSALGEHYAPLAETAGLGRLTANAAIVKTILSQSKNFDEVSFSRFMKITLELTADVIRTANDPEFIAYNDIFKKYVNEAVTSVEVLNINAAVTLERLLYKLKTLSTRGRYG
jgi:DNA polymerase-3 subunit gamma/tau